MDKGASISGNCVQCGTWRYSLHRDHIIPRWKGGKDDSSNIQLLCANCHEDKTREDLRGRKNAQQSVELNRERALTVWQRPEHRANVLATKRTPEYRERARQKALQQWSRTRST